jgi:hypothetical protein
MSELDEELLEKVQKRIATVIPIIMTGFDSADAMYVLKGVIITMNVMLAHEGREIETIRLFNAQVEEGVMDFVHSARRTEQ